MWSWVLSAVGVAGLFFVGRRKWWGWLIALFNEVLWIAYAFATKQYGFIIGALSYGAVHASNAARWRQQRAS